jgi:hypothetical protein
MARAKKSISILAVLSLVFVGTLIVFNQAFAYLPDCFSLKDYCEADCHGDGIIHDCWDDPYWGWVCWFDCEDCNPYLPNCPFAQCPEDALCHM